LARLACVESGITKRESGVDPRRLAAPARASRRTRLPARRIL
jgi:hypothetical protein